MVDDGRVDEHEILFAPRRAALGDELERLLGQTFGELHRIRNGRRRTEEDRVRAVVTADAAKTPEYVAQVAAEHTTVGMKFVQHDELEILEELRPSRMVRQNSRVQHVGIAQDQVRAAANR